MYPLKISIFSFDCAEKKSGIKCRAKAYVSVTVSEEECEPDVYTLVRIHTPEWHNHVPDNTGNICRSIIGKMMAEITKNPCAKIGMFNFYLCLSLSFILSGPMAKRVMLEETKVFDHNKPLKREILNSFPLNYLQTLYSHRRKIIGALPSSRDDFNPQKVLESFEFGKSVLVLDSNNLPEKWWEISLTSLIPSEHVGHQLAANAGLDVNWFDSSFDDFPPDWKPPRVVIYTTPELLELLCFCRKANVDGTFRTMSQLFEQLYVFLVEYKKTAIPCCMGFLPDKKRISYHVFVLMILLEFRERFGSEKLRLEKVKMDFELGLI